MCQAGFSAGLSRDAKIVSMGLPGNKGKHFLLLKDDFGLLWEHVQYQKQDMEDRASVSHRTMDASQIVINLCLLNIYR